MEINAAARLRVTAAPVESEDHETYMRSFFTQLKKQLHAAGAETGRDQLKLSRVKGALEIFVSGDPAAELKKLGWTKTKKTKTKNVMMYARKDGSWPMAVMSHDDGSCNMRLAPVDNISEI